MSYIQNPTWNHGAGPGIDAGALNALETQYLEAILSANPDLFTAGFVLSGMAASKDGTTATQLDLTAGTAYLLQSADSTVRQRKLNTSTFSTSGHPSATMYLDLNPDGSTSWSTSHSGVTNHLTIATVTTDGSSNISTVTDTRTTAASLLPNLIGALTLPTVSGLATTGNISGVAGTALPTTRNGSATSVPIYTGTSTPSSPPTGSVWIKARYLDMLKALRLIDGEPLW